MVFLQAMSYITPKQEGMVAVLNEQQQMNVAARDDEKIPLFLIKLWNIVEDPSNQNVIQWDEVPFHSHNCLPISSFAEWI